MEEPSPSLRVLRVEAWHLLQTGLKAAKGSGAMLVSRFRQKFWATRPRSSQESRTACQSQHPAWADRSPCRLLGPAHCSRISALAHSSEEPLHDSIFSFSAG